MHYRRLGRTNLNVSEVGFGAWAIGGNQYGNSYGPTIDDESMRAVRRALELGCNFFDTADVYGYGHSEEVLARALENSRKDVIVATKVGGNFYSGRTRMDFSPQHIKFAIEKSLQRLNTDYIDLYQLHNPPLEMIKDGKVFESLAELKKEGRIRFIGVSIFEPAEGVEAVKHGIVDTIQVVYNIYHQVPRNELFPVAIKNNVGIIVREPLANGFLTGKFSTEKVSFPQGDIRHNWTLDYLNARISATEKVRFLEAGGRRTLTQAAIRFALSDDAVSTAIPGAKTVKQVEENLLTTTVEPLAKQELEKVFALAERNFDL